MVRLIDINVAPSIGAQHRYLTTNCSATSLEAAALSNSRISDLAETGLMKKQYIRTPASPCEARPDPRLAGWGGRIRTSAWWNQNPLPYHLATPQ
jgi:hypothetical protein